MFTYGHRLRFGCLQATNLNRADLYRDTFIELVWSFGPKSPYHILPDRETNVKKFSTR